MLFSLSNYPINILNFKLNMYIVIYIFLAIIIILIFILIFVLVINIRINFKKNSNQKKIIDNTILENNIINFEKNINFIIKNGEKLILGKNINNISNSKGNQKAE